MTLDYSDTRIDALAVFVIAWAILLSIYTCSALIKRKVVDWSRVRSQIAFQSTVVLSLILPIEFLIVTLIINLNIGALEFNLVVNKTSRFQLNYFLITLLPIIYLISIPTALIYSFVLVIIYIIQQIIQQNIATGMEMIGNFLLFLTIVNLLSFFVPVRAMPQGFELCFFIISIALLTDIIAYIIGRNIYAGHWKIAPKISPTKTYDVMLACYVFTAIYSIIFRIVFLPDYSMITILSIGLLLTFLSQFGDLTFSLIKRNANTKDFGMLLPGIGGVWDAIDSFVFAGLPIYLIFH